MKRGDVVLARNPGSPASKARPCVVIQHTGTLAAQVSKVTVCALTSRIDTARDVRPLIAPTPDNGLRMPSAIEIDWIYTHPIDTVDRVIGTLDPSTLARVDTALRRWLDL